MLFLFLPIWNHEKVHKNLKLILQSFAPSLKKLYQGMRLFSTCEKIAALEVLTGKDA